MAARCTECGKPVRVGRDGTEYDLCYQCRVSAARRVENHRTLDRAPFQADEESLSPIRQRFATLTKALGYDPNWLLDQYMKVWVERVEKQLRPLIEDELLPQGEAQGGKEEQGENH